MLNGRPGGHRLLLAYEWCRRKYRVNFPVQESIILDSPFCIQVTVAGFSYMCHTCLHSPVCSTVTV